MLEDNVIDLIICSCYENQWFYFFVLYATNLKPNLNSCIALKISFLLKIADIYSISFLMVFCSNLSNQKFVNYKFAKKKYGPYKNIFLFSEKSTKIVYLCF
jgi:hypothetical protein